MAIPALIASKSFFNTNPIIIGIDQDNTYVMVSAAGIIKITEDNAVNLLRFLERDFHEFCSEIRKMIEEEDTAQQISITVSDFPFFLIVKAALSSSRDYWIELALPWLLEIGKARFKKDILDIQNNKQISQKLRHQLLKL